MNTTSERAATGPLNLHSGDSEGSVDPMTIVRAISDQKAVSSAPRAVPDSGTPVGRPTIVAPKVADAAKALRRRDEDRIAEERSEDDGMAEHAGKASDPKAWARADSVELLGPPRHHPAL